MNKATDMVARSRRGTPESVTPLPVNRRGSPACAHCRSRLAYGGRGHGAAHRQISGLLAVCFLVASLIALYQVAKIPETSSSAAHTSGSIRTIRNFYSGLNEYLETGDASALSKTLAPGALAFVPEQGAIGDDSGLLTYLLALRSTLPHLRYTVESIDAGGDIAIASVHTSGGAGAPASALPNESGISQEFFRVREGRIVQHWTTEPASALLHALTVPPMRIEVTQSGHLAIAELAFSADRTDTKPIDGPALVIVERGRLILTGDGASQILDIATGAASVPGPNENAFAGPGRAIFVPESRAIVRNGDSEAARARIATLVHERRQDMVGVPADPNPPPIPINDVSMMGSERTTIYDSVTVRPLAFDERSIPAGEWELEIAWAVLGPGAALPLSPEGEWSLARVISGSGSHLTQSQQADGGLATLMNDGDKPVVALVMRLRAASCADDAEC